MRKPTSDPILTAKLPRDLAATIRRLAQRDDRTTSSYIRRVLSEHVRQQGGSL